MTMTLEKRNLTLDGVEKAAERCVAAVAKARQECVVLLEAMTALAPRQSAFVQGLVAETWRLEEEWQAVLAALRTAIPQAKNDIPGQMRIGGGDA